MKLTLTRRKIVTYTLDAGTASMHPESYEEATVTVSPIRTGVNPNDKDADIIALALDTLTHHLKEAGLLR